MEEWCLKNIKRKKAEGKESSSYAPGHDAVSDAVAKATTAADNRHSNHQTTNIQILSECITPIFSPLWCLHRLCSSVERQVRFSFLAKKPSRARNRIRSVAQVRPGVVVESSRHSWRQVSKTRDKVDALCFLFF